jgi:hypothetical protein
MKTSPACSPRALAVGHVLRVEYCPCCDVLSLHFGPLTLRLDPAACECAWSTLGDALAALHRSHGAGERAFRRARRQGLAS